MSDVAAIGAEEQPHHERWLLRYVGRRLAAMAVLLFVLSFLTFSMLHLAPGSPVDQLIPQYDRTPEAIAAVTEEYHLDKPFLEQYWLWLGRAVRFDFGNSIAGNVPVSTVIRSRVGVTASLGIYVFALSMLVGVGLGVAAGIKRRSGFDRGVVAVTIVLVSTPAFVTATVLILVLGAHLQWFPTLGGGDGFTDRIYHLTLPAVSICLGAATLILRLTRATVMEVVEQDYVTFARARGAGRRLILFAYILRNALIPIITVGGLFLGSLLAGFVIIESLFGIPGLGQLFVNSINGKDFPVVQAMVLLTGTMVILANLLVDVLYVLVDPRIRFERTT